MSDTTQPLWYQLGFALEQARREPTRERLRDLGRKLSAFRTSDQGTSPARPARNGKTPARSDSREQGEGDPWGGLLAAAGGALVAALLKSWPRRGDPGAAGVIRAAGAGAAAAVLVEVSRRFLDGESAAGIEDVPERVLSGAARGVIYGAIAEPRLPGPPILRGLAWGGAEFIASPLGGLPRFLARHTPYGRLPLVKGAFRSSDEQDSDLLDHLVFGIALALLAGSS